MLRKVNRKLKTETDSINKWKLTIWQGALTQILHEIRNGHQETKVCRECGCEKPVSDFYSSHTCYKRNGELVKVSYIRNNCIKCFNRINEHRRKEREFKAILTSL